MDIVHVAMEHVFLRIPPLLHQILINFISYPSYQVKHTNPGYLQIKQCSSGYRGALDTMVPPPTYVRTFATDSALVCGYAHSILDEVTKSATFESCKRSLLVGR
jgi:hypothetical protein